MSVKTTCILLLALSCCAIPGAPESVGHDGQEQTSKKVAASGPKAFAQAVVYLSSGYRLEVEAITRLAPTLDPNSCSQFPVKEFGTAFSQGTTDAGSLETAANCVTARFPVPKGRLKIVGSTGVLQCDSEGFYECVALLFDTRGVQVWGDNFKGQGFLTRPASYVPFRGMVQGPLVLQVFTFTKGRTLPDRVE